MMWETLEFPFITLDTVATETPALFATSFIVDIHIHLCVKHYINEILFLQRYFY